MAFSVSSLQPASSESDREKLEAVELPSEQNPVVASSEYAYKVRKYATNSMLFTGPLNLPYVTDRQPILCKSIQPASRLPQTMFVCFAVLLSGHLQSSKRPNSRNSSMNRLKESSNKAHTLQELGAHIHCIYALLSPTTLHIR